jgi:wyosine [tRNA(Phe)-imidazoG37] synthetase (radical SAM superfamily)
MSTFLFDEIIYGPVNSRRLGLSLGVNLMPVKSKICSFDCIYCECGFNSKKPSAQLPTRQDVATALENVLNYMVAEGKEPDSITFSGNGEPTMHPDFPGIIKDTLRIKNKLCPESEITVLTNSTQLFRTEITDALKSIDNPYLKLDGAFNDTIQKIDAPVLPGFSVKTVVDGLKKFDGDFVLQTMFLRGEYNGEIIDNTTEKEIEAYLEIVKEVNPRTVTIYTIARNTPAENLQKISPKELDAIAVKIREIVPDVRVSY